MHFTTLRLGCLEESIFSLPDTYHLAANHGKAGFHPVSDEMMQEGNERINRIKERIYEYSGDREQLFPGRYALSPSNRKG
jgi:uncharacterized protein YktB (UPF0637 family)